MNNILLSVLLSMSMLIQFELYAQAASSSARTSPAVLDQAAPKDSVMHDHQLFTQILQTHVSPAGMVDYQALLEQPEALKAYLQGLAEVDKQVLAEQDDSVQMAFWINAYNALTLQVIIDYYPARSQGVFGGLFSSGKSITNIDGVWDKLRWEVATEQYTLDQIENQILRKQFSEPRIHFAIVCASMSCPDLRREAYTGLRLDRQLQEQTLRFLNNPQKGMHIDRARDRVSISSIFDWFSEDFDCAQAPLQIAARLSAKQSPVVCFIASQLLPSDPRREYLLEADYSLRFLDYDWSLNDQAQ